MNLSTRKNIGLEVVRALAALIVVYNHIFTFGLLPKNGLLELPAQFATEAVIIFFVLSGTVITLSVERNVSQEPRRFVAMGNYLRARVVRIYPIYALGLTLAALCQAQFDGSGLSLRALIGNALFLQTLGGYIVATPRYDPPLWSLANEMSYYLLFATSFCFPRAVILWAAVAFLSAIFLYPPSFGGALGHMTFVLSLSLPWLMGHWVAARRQSLPTMSIPIGVAFFAIGLCFARIQLTTEYYDAFRLTAFGACCCPLILALIQKPKRPESELQRRGWRTFVSLIGVAGLWVFSPSMVRAFSGRSESIGIPKSAPV